MQELKKFLVDNFKGLTLKAPLFYSWDASLRFDLQANAENSVNPKMVEYFENVLNRSSLIFESTFSSDDEIFIVINQFKGHSRKKIKFGNFVFKQIRDLKKKDTGFSIIKRLYDLKDKNDIWNIAVATSKTANLNYKELLKAISYTDFPTKNPNIQFETFIINKTKKIIFHMYDDRGLDIIASETKSLIPIYTNHKNWLLEYDLELMNERIKNVL